jgi:hypothetical protein
MVAVEVQGSPQKEDFGISDTGHAKGKSSPKSGGYEISPFGVEDRFGIRYFGYREFKGARIVET